MTDRARYHVEGQTSTVGSRWGIWDSAAGHFLRYRNIADEGDAQALCDKLNEYERAITPPEGDTVSEGMVEQVAKAFHGAMVYAVREFKGEPQPWQNGNSTAESYARREARDIIAALQSRPAVDPYAHRDGSRECRPASRVSPQAGMREALEYITRQDGKGPAGFIDWQRCVNRIQEVARRALSAATPAVPGNDGSDAEFLRKLARGELVDMGANERLDRIADRISAVAAEVTPAMLDAAMDAWDCSSGDERGRMWNAVEAALRQAIDPRP